MKKYLVSLLALLITVLTGYSQNNAGQAEPNKGDSFKIIFENGFLIGNPDMQYPMPFSSQISFMKKVKNLYLGAGSGAEVIGRTYIPFFADVRYLPFKSKPLFVYGKGGYALCLSNEYKEGENNYYDYYYYYYSPNTDYKYYGGLMGEAGLGIMLKFKNWDSSISIGYRYQKTSYEYTVNNNKRAYENYYNRLALRIGFWF